MGERSDRAFEAAWPWIMMGMGLLLLALAVTIFLTALHQPLTCPPDTTLGYRLQPMVQGRTVTTLMIPECQPLGTATPVDNSGGEDYHA